MGKSRQIDIKNIENETTKKIIPPTPVVDGLFSGGTAGRMLLRSEGKLLLFEQQQLRRVLGEIQAPKVKSAHWTSDIDKVALLCRFGVIIVDNDMEQLCTITETVGVKSGAWDSNNNIFVYTTLNHIKYCLANGDAGIILLSIKSSIV